MARKWKEDREAFELRAVETMERSRIAEGLAKSRYKTDARDLSMKEPVRTEELETREQERLDWSGRRRIQLRMSKARHLTWNASSEQTKRLPENADVGVINEKALLSPFGG